MKTIMPDEPLEQQNNIFHKIKVFINVVKNYIGNE